MSLGATQSKTNGVDELRTVFGESQVANARAGTLCAYGGSFRLLVDKSLTKVKQSRVTLKSRGIWSGSVWWLNVTRGFVIGKAGFFLLTISSGGGWVICFNNHLGACSPIRWPRQQFLLLMSDELVNYVRAFRLGTFVDCLFTCSLLVGYRMFIAAAT